MLIFTHRVSFYRLASSVAPTVEGFWSLVVGVQWYVCPVVCWFLEFLVHFDDKCRSMWKRHWMSWSPGSIWISFDVVLHWPWSSSRYIVSYWKLIIQYAIQISNLLGERGSTPSFPIRSFCGWVEGLPQRVCDDASQLGDRSPSSTLEKNMLVVRCPHRMFTSCSDWGLS